MTDNIAAMRCKMLAVEVMTESSKEAGRCWGIDQGWEAGDVEWWRIIKDEVKVSKGEIGKLPRTCVYFLS
jgi:hypothetical protein